MQNLTEIFNNRELAAIFWISILLILLQLEKPIRKSLHDVIAALFSRRIAVVNCLAFLYTAIVILFLSTLHFWDMSLLKDSIFWYIGSGSIVLMNLSKAGKEHHFFNNILRDSIKLTVVLEFIVFFHQFSLITEIILFPLVLLFTGVKVRAEMDEKTKKVAQLVDWLFFGYAMILAFFSLRDIIQDFSGFANIANVKSFMLPIILTILFIPFFYLIALYMNYEVILKRMSYLIGDRQKYKFARNRLVRICGFSLGRVRSISPKIDYLYRDVSIDEIETIINQN